MQEGSSEYILLESNNFIENYRKIWERLILTKGIENSQLASETPAIEALIFMDYIKEMSKIKKYLRALTTKGKTNE